jgi:fumarylacetoacetase
MPFEPSNLFRFMIFIQDPIPSSYLIDSNNSKDAYDVHLQVKYKPKGSSKFHTVVQSNLKYMYWTFKQQLAHHTVNGCNMKSGDLCGTGTLSGPTKISMGSFLELTANGKEPIQMEDMSRTFLEDGDEIEFNGICIGKSRIGFGACSGVIIE